MLKKFSFEIKNLCVKNILYDINLNLNFPDGAFISLIGQNGSGKTTLLRALTGLQKYSGSIKLNNVEIKNYSRRNLAGYITLMQSSKNFNPVHPFNVKEIISMSRLHLKNLFSGLNSQDEQIILNSAKIAGVEKFLLRNIMTLSDGEKQLILFAGVLAQETQIILLDEPTSALDPDKSLKVFKILRELANNGKIIIAAVHDLNISAGFSDYYIGLKNGKLLFNGKNLNANILKDLYNVNFEEYKNKSGGLIWLAI